MAIKITYFVHGTTTDNKQHISSGWKDVEYGDSHHSLAAGDFLKKYCIVKHN